MYIQKVEIKNIRSIENFVMEFPAPAGWHVIIGDNGAGKSTVIKAISLALLGNYEAKGLAFYIDFNEWLTKNKTEGSIALEIFKHKSDVSGPAKSEAKEWVFNVLIKMKSNSDDTHTRQVDIESDSSDFATQHRMWLLFKGWFSCGFGPSRRFTGGDENNIITHNSNKRIGSYLSVFWDSLPLKESIKWLDDLNYKRLEGDQYSKVLLDTIIDFINQDELLPNDLKFKSVSSEGIYFLDSQGRMIDARQLSDGIRSILSLTFELIRQLVLIFSYGAIFSKDKNGKVFIHHQGVVLIDEIDAHLHPSWQTRIGTWFTEYFPNIQFIVTTHSPLVCRACEKGSIWRLAAPGGGNESGEITGTDKQRLIFGNILDAYGTDVFGNNTSQSESANLIIKELAELNVKSFKGKITEFEKKRLIELKNTLPTGK